MTGTPPVLIYTTAEFVLVALLLLAAGLRAGRFGPLLGPGPEPAPPARRATTTAGPSRG